MSTFAFKRLSAVEISPDISHQHELNAGALRKGLGFPLGRSEGPLTILAVTGTNDEPVVLEGTFTVYDAREQHPTRSEYRMYYRLPGLSDVAQPDDLLVLYRERESGGLDGILARPGTPMERRLEELLRIEDSDSLRHLIVRVPERPTAGTEDQWVHALLPLDPKTRLAGSVRDHPLLASATQAESLPSTKKMAAAGDEIAAAVWPVEGTPDERIWRGLEAESALYFAIEREVGTRALRTLQAGEPARLEDMLTWALRIQQSRKSRRGQSLQHHFGFLLTRLRIPHAAQCRTEGGETPDFIVPDCSSYHDPAFPSERLRIVACKSTVRERWGQILKEADRVREKYLLTVDEQLSGDAIESMHRADLRVFVPANVIVEHYAENASRERLGTVALLVELLKAAL